MTKCEVCGVALFHGIPGIPCDSEDQPTLFFCPKHYIEHVEGAHSGIPLPGRMSLNAARMWQASKGGTEQ